MRNVFIRAWLLPVLIIIITSAYNSVAALTYDITTYSGGNNAIINRTSPFVANDVLNIKNDISANVASGIGNIGAFALNIKGNDYSISGKYSGTSYPGFSVVSGGVYTFNQTNLNLFNSTAAATGGAITNTNGVVTIIDGSFTDNTSSAAGGAIYNNITSSGRTLNVSNTSFSGNSSSLGGAIYNAGTRATTLTNDTFTGNTATQYGGAIYNAGVLYIQANGATSLFTGNKVGSDANDLYLASGTVYLNAGNGGVITFDGAITSAAKANQLNINTTAGSLTLTNGTINFNNNISTATINIANGTTNVGSSSRVSNLTLDNVAFAITGGSQYFIKNNFTGGSKITVTSINTLNISDSEFAGGAVVPGSGGAINVTSGTTNITDTNFTGYSASVSGGAIANTGTTTTTITGTLTGTGPTAQSSTTFLNNTAGSGSGGAINNTANSVLTEVKFDHNTSNAITSAAGGGAIYNSGIMTITNGIFINNTTTSKGGAIYNTATAMGNVSAGTVFDSNTATGSSSDGGAIYTLGSSTLTGVTFTKNTAFRNGGAFYCAGNTISLTDNIFTDNGKTGATATTQNGGAVYNDVGTLTITDGSFTTNASKTSGGAIANTVSTTLPLNIYGTSFTNNSSRDGGAIYNTGILHVGTGATVATFRGNNASGNGGAIYNSGTATETIGTIFDLNTATGTLSDGGAIYTLGSSTLTSVTFTNNAATRNGGALYCAGNTVTLTDITFTDNGKTGAGTTTANGGAIYNSAGTLTITDGSFTNNASSATGGAITNAVSATLDLDIYGASFTGNSSRDGGAIYNAGRLYIAAGAAVTTFTGNIASQNGGAIYGTGTGSIIAGTIFDSNRATSNGGAIYATGTPTFEDVTFKNNSAVINGGAVFSQVTSLSFVGCTFTDNGKIGATTQNGGAIYNNTGTLIATDSTFTTNAAEVSGGAILSTGGTLTISGSDFTSNTAVTSGGAIQNDAGTTINMTKSTFTSNSSINGGAIYNAATLFINEYGTTGSSLTTFTGNTASGYGGAIYGIGSSGSISSGTIFDSNTAGIDGGAIYTSGTPILTGSTFKKNFAERNGGALYCAGTSITIKDDIFTDNGKLGAAIKTLNGGALYNAIGTITIADSTFTSNAVTTSGGALFSTGGTLSMTGGEFTNNTAGVSGGAVINEAGTTMTMTNSTFTSNSSVNGGAIYNDASLSINEYGTTGSTSTTFTGNTASGKGGAIFGIGVGTISKGTVFDSNSATIDGGAVYNTSGTPTFTGVTFKNNYTGGNGGAIYNTSTVLTLKTNTFTDNGKTNNTATTQNGGAVYDDVGTATISDSSFTGNAVTDRGGAVFSSGGTTTLTNDTFTSNTAGVSGGAIYNEGPTAITLTNCTFTDNGKANGTVTTTNGGAAYNADGTMTITGGSFTNNASTTAGGAIYNNTTAAKNTNASNTTFTGNSSATGGAIYSSSTLTINNCTFNDNIATTLGGAIYNTSTANINANNGITSFSGNKANGISNAIYMNAGILNLNSTLSSYILFDDKIGALDSSSVINVNNTSTSMTGKTVFNEQVTNASLRLSRGTLTLGEYHNTKLTDSTGLLPSNTYLDNVALTLTGGILDASNGNIDSNNLASISSVAAASLLFDANLSTGTNDRFTVSGTATGTLTLKGVNILADGSASSLTLFTNLTSPVLTAVTAYTSTSKYVFSQSATVGVLNITKTASANGLNEAVLNTSTNRSFSATGVTTTSGNLATMGGASGSTLTIFGNQNTITGTIAGGNSSGIIVTSGRTLNVYDAGLLNADGTVSTSIQNFKSTNGGFISNAGTVNIADSVFSNNEATALGGALQNTGTLAVADSAFVQNKAANGGAIYNTSGTTTITNSTFSGNTATSYGGAIQNLAGTTTVTDSSFTDNSAIVSGGAIYISAGTVAINAAGKDVTFSGNKQAGSDNDIYMASGSLNLTANGDYKITLNGGIQGAGTITKAGIGELVINGINNSFTGTYSNTAGKVTIKSEFFTGTNSFTAGTAEIQTNGSLTLNSLDTWTATNITNTGGTLTLDGFSHTTGGTYNQTSGTLTLSNPAAASTLTLLSGSTISAGNVAYTGTLNTLNIAAGAVFASDAAVNISSGNNFKVTGGIATLNGTGTGSGIGIDTWDGAVTLTGGTLTLNNFTHDATTGGDFSQTGGILKLLEGSDLTVASGKITSAGEVDISSTTSTKSNLKIVYGAATSYINNVKLQGNGQLTIDTGINTVTNTSSTLISATGSGNEFIKIGSGAYNFNLASTTGDKDISYGFNIKEGTVNVTGLTSGILKFDDAVNLGGSGTAVTLNLNPPSTGSIDFNGKINSDSISNIVEVNNITAGTGTVNFNSDIEQFTLNITKGTTNFGTSDITNVNVDNVAVNIVGGKQTFTNTTLKNATRIYLNDATPTAAESTNFVNSTFSGYSYAGSGAAIYNNSGNLNVSSSSFSNFNSTGDGGAVYNKGTATFTNTNFTSNATGANGGAIYNSGTLNIQANGGTSTFSGNTAAGDGNAIYNDGTIYLNAGTGSSITFADTIKSSAITKAININSTTGSLTLTSGTINFNNTVSTSTVNLYSGTMALSKESYFDGTSNLAIAGGTINTQNNNIGTMELNNLSFLNNGVGNWLIDVDLANVKGDEISSATAVTTTGTLNISGIKLWNDSTAAVTPITVANANTKGYVTTSVNETEGLIYKYLVSYNGSGSTGVLNFTQNGFSPSVITGNVSQTQTFLLQTAIDRQFFGNVDAFMSFPLAARESTICCALSPYNTQTTGAACPISGNGTFSPIYSCDLNKGIWVKDFVSFENIPLQNGPNVSTVEYGTLIGADAPLKYLGHGVVGNTSAYVGYLGSNQNYDSVGVSQNGALVGLAENMVKGNNFLTLMASVGASLGNSITQWGNDYFSSLFAGVAAKGGHNFEFKDGEYIIQPNLMLAYTFTNTPDYTSASGVNMSSKPLNAMQIAPGVRFIKNLKQEKGQVYLVGNFVYNIMDKTRFTANDVQLPQLAIAPYFEYGIGYQRVWKERFTGFAQTLLRGGGRNGVALQFGLRWAI